MKSLYLKFYAVLFLCLAMYSCSDSGLNEAEALSILKQDYEEICRSKIREYAYVNSNNSQHRYYYNQFKALESMGVLKIIVPAKKNSKYRSVKLTRDAEVAFNYIPRNGGSVEFTRFEPKAIVGISMIGDNKATVLFSGDMVANRLHSIINNKQFCKPQNNAQREVTFTKYDTGWRLDK